MKAAPVAFVLLLAGCAGIPRYSSDLPKNLAIVTEINSGAHLKSTQAALDVHRITARCETEHRGRLNLDTGQTELGIPEERLLLDFIFVTKGVFSGTGATRYSTMLTPRPGYEYRAHVSYNQGVYDVVIREARKGSAQGRVLESMPISRCRPA